MMNTQLIALLSAAAAAGVALLMQESLKEMIKKGFSDITPQRVRTILFVVILGIGVVFYFGGFALGESITPEEPETIVEDQQDSKTKEEVILEGAKVVIDETKEFIENKQIKDSIFIANRERVWVYKIGLSIDDESDAWDAAMKVNSLGNISIFKEGRKSYFVICDPAWEEDMLYDSLESYQNKLNQLNQTARMDVVDLMDNCSKKQHITQTSSIEKKKQETTFPCLTCDK